MRIAIVGVGPRGLSALERIISHGALPGPQVEVTLLEPGELGIGIHRLKQPDYLLLNTIASQLTIYSDDRMTPGAPVTVGPSFFDWCQDHYSAVRFDDFLPRRVLGEYLQWAAADLISRIPKRVSVRRLSNVATSVRPQPSGVSVHLDDGGELDVDLAIVTTGHGLSGPAPFGDDLTVCAYPLPEQVDQIPAGATVGILGTGLTAMDIIAALTLGRGGSFDSDAYHPSGREPQIVLVNRAGFLPCGRPATTVHRRAAPAKHLTAQAVVEARKSAQDGLLDFARDIEPLIHREALDRMQGATPAEIEAVKRILNPSARRWRDHDEYFASIIAHARFDLAEAERGLGASPVKEALEILRDHRDGLRAAVDAPGLTGDSHRYFMQEFVPLVNRVVIGPQKERIHELLKLIEAGIVELGPGPRPELKRTANGWNLCSTRLEQPHEVAVDVVVSANLHWPTRRSELDPVSASLREWSVPGQAGGTYLALDRDGYVRSPHGATSIAVFGPPAEGASYYNHYVPSPGVWSRALTDLDRVIGPRLT